MTIASDPANSTERTFQNLSEDELRLLFDKMISPFSYCRMVYDAAEQPVDYIFLAVNRAFEIETGKTREEVIGRRALDLFPDTEQCWIDCFGRVAKTGNPEQITAYSSELKKWYSLHAYSPKPDQVAITVSDVTSFMAESDMLEVTTQKLKAQQDENYRLAHEEPITGLPNRACLYETFESISADRKHAQFSIAIFAPDNLAEILAAYGSVLSDGIMRIIAQRVNALFTAPNACFSMTGTDFVLLYGAPCDEREMRHALSRAHKAIRQAVEINGNVYYITASSGVACFPRDGTEHDDLITKANLALYESKRTGESVVFFNDAIGQAVLRRTQIRNALPKALENKEFELYFQPQLQIASDCLIGFEALLRWHSPVLGEVAPLEFIGVAEESRHILPLGAWVMLSACRVLSEINQSCRTKYTMSVNVSGIQLHEEKFVDQVFAVLSETGLSPESLELEVTESVLLNRELHAIEKLNALHERGVRIALDDFGTGYSSLSLLKDLKISTLKIDKHFIQDMSAFDLTKMIVRLGHLLGAEAIAEGVENEEQMRYARRLGCERVQGFYKALPMPLESLKRYVGVKESH